VKWVAAWVTWYGLAAVVFLKTSWIHPWMGLAGAALAVIICLAGIPLVRRLERGRAADL
jgi:hypothetical protein